MTYRSRKTGKVYDDTSVKEAFEAFWAEMENVSTGLRSNVLPKRPINAWERYLSALQLEIVGL